MGDGRAGRLSGRGGSPGRRQTPPSPLSAGRRAAHSPFKRGKRMTPEEFEHRMRELEYFHSVRLLPGVWTVIRVDGRGFSRFTESRFEKPFDPRMRDLMV